MYIYIYMFVLLFSHFLSSMYVCDVCMSACMHVCMHAMSSHVMLWFDMSRFQCVDTAMLFSVGL